MSELLQKWKNATAVLKEFDHWNSLPNLPTNSEDHRFELTMSMCVPPTLVRAGRHKTAAAIQYANTTDEVREVILEWLVDNWDTVQVGVRKILEDKERQALLDCEQFVEEMQATIDNAKMQERYTVPSSHPLAPPSVSSSHPLAPPSMPKPEDFDDDIPF